MRSLCPQGLKKIAPEKLSRIPELIEPWFIFSLIWSVGATGDSVGRSSFSHWLRIRMKIEEVRGAAPWPGPSHAGDVCAEGWVFRIVPWAQAPRGE